MKKILVLEDEANIRSFVVINLNRAGYETIEAGTGEEALEQLRLNPDVRVALLDIMLPDMDGFEVCRRIRNTIWMSSSGLCPERSIRFLARSTILTGSPISRTKISPPFA